MLNKTTKLLADKQHVTKLTERNCKLVSFDDIRRDVLKVLGTMIGRRKKREEFLGDKIRKEVEKVSRLKNLPHQRALLLLRFCIQQNL